MENKSCQIPNVRHGIQKSAVETDFELRKVQAEGEIWFLLDK